MSGPVVEDNIGFVQSQNTHEVDVLEQQLQKKIKLALTLNYFKILRIYTMCTGGWPGEVLGEKLPFIYFFVRKLVPSQTTVVLVGGIYYLYENHKHLPFLELGHMYITTFLSALTISRSSLSSFKNFGVVSKRFFSDFHLIHYIHKGEYYEKMHMKMNKVSIYFTTYLMSVMSVGLVLFNLSPMYQNITHGVYSNNIQENFTRQFSVYYSLPGFHPLESHFYLCTIYNYILSVGCAVTVCSVDLYLSLMAFQIIGHVQILRHNLENMTLPKTLDKYDKEENANIHRLLTSYIDHHRFIVSFTDVMSEFFGPTLAAYYLFHLVNGCLMLLEVTKPDPVVLARYGPLTMITLGQLIQISVVFEVVGHVSEKLIDSVYFVPWEFMDVRNQRTLLFLLNRVQTTMYVMAIGTTSVGVQTMTGILKTTFSYFMFLRTIER